MGWKRLRWFLLPLAGLALAGLAVVFFLDRMFAPICETASGAEVVAPSGQHIARQYSTYCNVGFGNASEAHLVAVRKSSETVKGEIEVFTTFDQPPSIEWHDDTHLLIVVNGVHTIHKSLRRAKDLEIVYRLRTQLTEAYLRAEMQARQRQTASSLGEKHAEAIRRQYESFIAWAKENAAMN
jgi:hypothetical protein